MADLNELKSSQLEKAMGNTVFSRYKSVMDKYIIRNLKNGGDFSIPIIQTLVGESPELEKRLIELYERKMAMVDTSHISNEMKILQASAFDGLVFGLNVEKGMQMEIYTANLKAIFGCDGDSKFTLEKTLELNEQGIVHAMRIDVEYTSEEGFMFKPVSLNKNTNLKIVDLDTMEGRFFLVPFIAIQRSMAFFKEQLDDGRTLEVTQERGSILKVRNISSRGSELAKYCDDEEFAKSLKAEYFPLKGFFYAPVLGASSYTVGRTRIELTSICKVASVTKPKVEKAGGAEYMLEEASINYILSDMYKCDEEGYAELISKLPKKEGIFVGEMCDLPTPTSVITYYRQLNSSDKEKVKSLIPVLKENIARWGGIITTSEKVNVEGLDAETLKGMLKEGVYKILVRKKDCGYTTSTVTNNKKLLRKMYGNNYFKEYESFGVRIYSLENMVENGSDVQEAMLDCGFEEEMGKADDVLEIIKTHDPQISNHERLAILLGESEDGKKKTTRRSSSNGDTVLARACFATITGAGSSDYYKYIDVSRIVSIYKVG